MKPLVYITRKLPDESLIELKKHTHVEMWHSDEEPMPRELLLEKAKAADAMITMLSDKLDAHFFEEAHSLKAVANLAVGYDNIDVEAAYHHGVIPCHTPDVLTDTTADLAFVLMMAAGRRLIEAADYVKMGKWQNWSPMLLAGQDIHHKTLGIVGMGRIGQVLAKRAYGFDMKVLYHNRRRHEKAELELGVTYSSFENLLKQSDYVVCLTPLTNETKNMFNKEAFQLMKSTSVFVNVSRGAVVDEEALYKALVNKEIYGAGLDVYREEPAPADHPLVKLKQVVALPHIGSASVETRLNMIDLAVENVLNVLEGKEAVTPVPR